MAGKFLDEWCSQVMRSRIEPMKKIAGTLRSHRALILNYSRARKQFSSGVVEGLNNKAKLTMRKSYGFAYLPRHGNRPRGRGSQVPSMHCSPSAVDAAAERLIEHGLADLEACGGLAYGKALRDEVTCTPEFVVGNNGLAAAAPPAGLCGL